MKQVYAPGCALMIYKPKAVCCGDSFYGVLPIELVKKQMKRRSDEMPCENVTKIRVHKAAEFLEQKDIDIFEIAYMSGFKSLSNFYKCFKEQFGITPRQYRNNQGNFYCKSI